MMGDGPAVSVVIPVLDPGPMLLACLASVGLDDDRVEVVVVDNGSMDGTPAEAAEKYPGIRVVRNERNLGFATACNQGVAGSHGQFVLLLNVDATLPRDALDRLLEAAAADPDAALWQPVILSLGGDVENAGELFSWSGFFVRLRELPPMDGSPYGVFACTAACLLVRRTVFEDLGGFRESYFAYIEDMDLCWRARLAGWEVRVVPSVRVTHAQNVTTRRIFAIHEFRHLTFRNRLRTILANGSVLTMARMLPLYVVLSLVTALTLLMSGRARSAMAIVLALLWPLPHRAELAAQRRGVRAIRKLRDGQVLRPDLAAPLLTWELGRLFRGHYRRWEEMEH